MVVSRNEHIVSVPFTICAGGDSGMTAMKREAEGV